jgi:MFS family permease
MWNAVAGGRAAKAASTRGADDAADADDAGGPLVVAAADAKKAAPPPPPASLRAASASAGQASAPAGSRLRPRTHSRSNLLPPGAARLSSSSGGGGGSGAAAAPTASAAAAAAANRDHPPSSSSAPAPDGHPRPPSSPSAAAAAAAPPPNSGAAALVDRALAKTTRRLVPVVLAIVGLNYLDRTALSFAGVSLSAELGLSASDFGLASGAFFLGYSLLQLPSNLVAMRVGARAWLTFLTIAWGVAASAFAALRTPSQLVWLRFLLGAAEAGAFPCIWFALSLFYPRDKLTRPYASMLVAVAVSQVVAAPLAAAMLSLDGKFFGLRGWQVVFLAEGIPAVLLGLALPWLLPDGPGDAAFLTPGERDALRAAVDRAAAAGDALMTAPSGELLRAQSQQQQQQQQQQHHDGGGAVSGAAEHDDDEEAGKRPGPSSGPPPPPSSFSSSQQQQLPMREVLALVRATASRPELWVLALANVLKDMAAFAALFFCPLIVASLIGGGGGGGGGGGAPAASLAPSPTGALPVLLTAVPFGAAAAATYAWSGRAQEKGDPAWHAAVPFMAGGLLFALYPACAFLGAPALAMASLTAGLVGAFCGGPLIVVLVTAAAPPQATAVALPLFNSVGMVGGFLGPVLLGAIVDATPGGGYGAGAAAMGAALCAAGGVLWALRAHKLRRRGVAGAGVEFVPLSSGGKGSAGGGGGGSAEDRR